MRVNRINSKSWASCLFFGTILLLPGVRAFAADKLNL
jgi:hypothetical protein